ncbi:MAG: energy-coupling factor ABC transporter permease [Coriobacteriales bacterium]|jgi:cobalt/nickel transport system permease protein|nr:energy-coupling factor ABC transporter permease [Coriobacteriales bacterium]
MHIPDGMLDTKTFTTLWVGAAGGLGYAGHWIRKHFDQSKIVLMAVLAALIFGLQMLNFPIAGGTSGHFGGGALAGLLLGTWPGVVVMAAVLLVQALFFGDGGITTLGANIVNMGIIGALVAPFVYQLFQRVSSSSLSKILGAALGAFLAVVLSSAVVAIELWASGSAQFFAALTAMVSWHTLIGIGEAIITGGIIAYIVKVRPQILDDGEQTTKRSFRSVCVVLGALALLATGLSFLASSFPDGLEFVYFDMGVGTAAIPETTIVPALMPDYVLPGIANETLAGVAAGVIGAIVTGAFLWAVISVLARKRRQDDKRTEN